MNLVHHKNLNVDRWQHLSLCERLANVGSEIHRAISWRERNPEYAQLAVERALELLDLTIETAVGEKARLRELTRAREALIDYFLCDNQYGSSDTLWQKYFDAFTYAAATGAWQRELAR
jgi:hypothetical protein